MDETVRDEEEEKDGDKNTIYITLFKTKVTKKREACHHCARNHDSV